MSALAFWKTLASQLETGHRVFLALVAENTRHSPGTAGARLFLSETGERAGTIGGGVMEYKLLERAAEALERGDFAPEVQTLHHRRSAPGGPTDGERSGMICAGSQTNLYTLCRPETELPPVRRAVALLEAGASGTLAITPRGMAAEEREPDLSRPPFRLERGAEGWRYEEELLNRRRLALLGGGHCARALARLMSTLGYDVFVFETREQVFEEELERVARSVEIVADFRLAGERIRFPELTWAVVMTTDFPSDVKALAGLLRRPLRFIGLMGAPAKVAEIRKRLREEGFTGDELARIRAPVGLEGVPSHTPEEIAVSVAAQILALRED